MKKVLASSTEPKTTMKKYGLTYNLALATLGLGLVLAGNLSAAIVMENTGSAIYASSSGGSSFNHNFDAGASADAILLSLSAESSAAAGEVSITYDGVAFTPVIDHIGSQPSVWLLNLSDTTYTDGAATLTLDLTGVTTVNGYGAGFVSVATNDALLKDLGVHATNTSTSDTVGLTTTLESFVIAGHRANDQHGSASADAPLTQLFGAQIGSSQGAAGYEASVAAGSPSYSFTGSSDGELSSAAAFVAVPEPASLALLTLVGGACFIIRRRFRR